MTKYREYYDLMLKKNQPLFAEFREIHDRYVLDPQKHQETFNRIGADIQDIITEYENRLCHHSEKGVYAKYSHQLADKFWELIRQDFPKVDDIGIEISYDSPPAPNHSSRKPLNPPKPHTILDDSPEDIIKDALDNALDHLKKTNL